MNIKAVVYTSQSGHTKRYAELFGEKTGLPVYEGKEAKKALAKGDEIIYFGWIMAGKIQGYENAWKQFEVRAVASVGLYSAGDRLDEYLRRNNIILDPELFCLQGGIVPGNLSRMHKMLMNVIIKSARAKQQKGQELTPEEIVMLDAWDESRDFVCEENLADLIAWYEGNK